MSKVIGDVLGTAAGLVSRRRADAEPAPRSLPPLDPAATRDLLEERTQRQLGLSAEEFIRRLKARELPDSSTVHALAMLVGEDLSPRPGT